MPEQSLITTITAIIGVATLLAGIIQYGITKRDEFRKRFWEERLEVYRRACALAATLATAKHITDVENEKVEFFKLYWGELAILENEDVKTAMEAFGIQLKNMDGNAPPPDILKELSYKLARECRKSLEKTWDPVDLDDLTDNSKELI